MSFGQGTEGEWWSLLNFNSEKYGPYALEISYLKIFIFSFFSALIAYFITKLMVKKEEM